MLGFKQHPAGNELHHIRKRSAGQALGRWLVLCGPADSLLMQLLEQAYEAVGMWEEARQCAHLHTALAEPYFPKVSLNSMCISLTCQISSLSASLHCVLLLQKQRVIFAAFDLVTTCN